jgi:hypothetical protein
MTEFMSRNSRPEPPSRPSRPNSTSAFSWSMLRASRACRVVLFAVEGYVGPAGLPEGACIPGDAVDVAEKVGRGWTIPMVRSL